MLDLLPLAQIEPWEIIVTSIQGLLTLILGGVVTSVGWSLRRVIEQNDAEHAELKSEVKASLSALDTRIDRLVDAITAEANARHLCAEKKANELSDIKEERPRREEIIAQYGALSQKIQGVSEQLHELAGRVSK